MLTTLVVWWVLFGMATALVWMLCDYFDRHHSAFDPDDSTSKLIGFTVVAGPPGFIAAVTAFYIIILHDHVQPYLTNLFGVLGAVVMWRRPVRKYKPMPPFQPKRQPPPPLPQRAAPDEDEVIGHQGGEKR